MGCCYSCLKFHRRNNISRECPNLKDDHGVHIPQISHLELSEYMSSPNVKIDGMNISGKGLALVNLSIEQDSSYWEWHIKCVNFGRSDKITYEKKNYAFQSKILYFGVATIKTPAFYEELGFNELKKELCLMRPISSLQKGDIVGLAVQHSDLPMIQFYLNGEPLHEISINRFRGTVYPSVYLHDEVSIIGVFNENNFQQLSPHVRFGPLIPAREII